MLGLGVGVMIEVKNEQIYDLYIAGYRIFEIASIFKCSESTIKRKRKKFKKRINKNI